MYFYAQPINVYVNHIAEFPDGWEFGDPVNYTTYDGHNNVEFDIKLFKAAMNHLFFIKKDLFNYDFYVDIRL